MKFLTGLLKAIVWLIDLWSTLPDPPKDPPPPKPEKPEDPKQPEDPPKNPPRPIPPPPPIDAGLEQQRFELLLTHNRLRERSGLNALAINPELNRLAQRQAEFLAAVNESRQLHRRPTGRSFDSDLRELTFSYRTGGENAAFGQRSVAEVVTAWDNSPGHSRNMRSSRYSKVGFGVYRNRQGRIYWITIFVG